MTTTTYPIVHVFRAFAVESYVPGRPYLSTVLLAFSWSTILFNLMLGHYVFFIVEIFQYTVVLDFVAAMLAIGMFVSHVAITLHSIVRRRDIADILVLMHHLDRLLLAKFNRTVPRKYMCTKYACIICVFIAMIASTMLFYFAVIQSWKIAFVVFISMVTRVRCLQMVFYVHHLHDRLLLVIATLRQGAGSDVDLSNQVAPIFDGIWCMCEQINDCFGLSLLVVTADVFLETVVNCYLVCVQHFNTAVFGLLSTMVIFAVVCWTCDDCVQSYSECVDVARRIQSDDDGPTMPARQALYLQLLQQRIFFHATGIYQLNLKLVGSIFAVTMTYIIVLVQFSG